MDENTWRFAQVMMWLIGIQTTVIIAAFAGMWMAISNRFFGLESRMEKLDKRMEKLESDLGHLKDDMIEVKTVLRLKECCMIQDEKHMKKAE